MTEKRCDRYSAECLIENEYELEGKVLKKTSSGFGKEKRLKK